MSGEQSRRYPWPVRSVDELRAELGRCPLWARSKAGWLWRGRLIRWTDAVRIVAEAGKEREAE